MWKLKVTDHQIIWLSPSSYFCKIAFFNITNDLRHHLIFANMKITNYNLSDHLHYHLSQIFEKLFSSKLQIIKHHLIFANVKITNYKSSHYMITSCPWFLQSSFLQKHPLIFDRQTGLTRWAESPSFVDQGLRLSIGENNVGFSDGNFWQT